MSVKGMFLHLYFADGKSVRLPVVEPLAAAPGDLPKFASRRWLTDHARLHGACRVELRRFGRILAAYGKTPASEAEQNRALNTMLAASDVIVRAAASREPTRTEVHYEHG